MKSCVSAYKKCLLLVLLAGWLAAGKPVFAQHNVNDTINAYAIIYNGDTIEAKTLQTIFVKGRYTKAQLDALAEWTRLRNAVYVTYPYARKAGLVFNDVTAHLVGVTNSTTRKNYIQSREKELRKEFEEPLKNLSIYQGKVLMKLINRETGNNCYDIVKEFKGGFVARVYQTVAFFFSTSLKQPYDKSGEDAIIEKIVQDVERMYGYRI